MFPCSPFVWANEGLADAGKKNAKKTGLRKTELVRIIPALRASLAEWPPGEAPGGPPKAATHEGDMLHGLNGNLPDVTRCNEVSLYFLH